MRLPVGDDAHSLISLRFASIGLTLPPIGFGFALIGSALSPIGNLFTFVCTAFPQLKQALPVLQSVTFVSDCLQLVGRCL